MGAGSGDTRETGEFPPRLSCGGSQRQGYFTGMTGFHVTSEEGWRSREGTCGRNAKEFPCRGVGGGPEKGGAVQPLRGCCSELEGTGQEGTGRRGRGFSLETRAAAAGCACVGPANVCGEGSRPGVPLEQGGSRSPYHFIEGKQL